MVLLFIPWWLTFYWGVHLSQRMMLIVHIGISLVWLAIYFTTSACAVFLFVRNLLRINVQSLDDPKTNERHTQIIELSTKYLTLFLLAMFSTILSFVVANALGGPMVSVLFPFDMSANVVCMLLQYPFAQAQYSRLCIKPNSCIRTLLVRRVKHFSVRDSLSTQSTRAADDTQRCGEP